MRFAVIAAGTAFATVLLAGCASSPGTKQPPSMRWIAPPAAGADHLPSIDITYKNRHPPHYPVSAVVAHHQGRVVLAVFVDAQSRVSKVEVEKSSGYPELDAAAAAAAQDWRFAAGVRDGEPYASVVLVPVTFSM
jgi:protein TonB